MKTQNADLIYERLLLVLLYVLDYVFVCCEQLEAHIIWSLGLWVLSLVELSGSVSIWAPHTLEPCTSSDALRSYWWDETHQCEVQIIVYYSFSCHLLSVLCLMYTCKVWLSLLKFKNTCEELICLYLSNLFTFLCKSTVFLTTFLSFFVFLFGNALDYGCYEPSNLTGFTV